MKAVLSFRLVVAASLVALSALAACTRTGAPAPVELRGLTGTAPPPRAAAAGRPGGVAAPVTSVVTTTSVVATTLPRGGADGHLVARGETLYGVARQYDVPVRALIDANGLQPPYQLVIGQRLVVPQQPTHTVVAGDTLYSISRRYGVDMSEVVRLNTISPPYAVKLGERLLLPAPVAVAGASPAPAAPVASVPSPLAPSGAVAAAPPTGVAVAVTPLAPPMPTSAIPAPPPAAAAGPAAPLPEGALADSRPTTRPPISSRREPTPLAAPEPSPGTTPGAVASAAIPAAPVIAVPAAPIEAVPAPAPPTPVIVGEPATPLPEVPADSAPRRQATVTEPPPPPPRAARTFLWPLRGRVLATYGERGGGQHNDGINIAATRGTPVHAAENGVVAYAGNEIRGFGNLLLIRHADGYMTAYAHNDELLVQRGDVVRRGQVVARVGSTGNVTQPQLHFEVRKGTQAIDPETVLGNPAQASAN